MYWLRRGFLVSDCIIWCNNCSAFNIIVTPCHLDQLYTLDYRVEGRPLCFSSKITIDGASLVVAYLRSEVEHKNLVQCLSKLFLCQINFIA